jgi:hypothetical protein
MATSTTRLGLVKPLTSENYDVTIVNSNSDKVDAAMGFAPVTSGTRPAAPFNGQTIRETDTGKTYFHNGSTPASAGWVQIPNVSSNIDLGSSVVINWGADVNLYRSAANTLKTDDAFIALGQISASGGLVVTGNETVSGSSSVAGNASVGGALAVTGTITQGGKPLQLKNRLFSGSITITPVANSATLGTLTYGTTLDGTVFRAQATANTAVPGGTVLGVSVGTVTASACQVYVYRTNTTNTVVHVLVIGSDA